MLVIVSKNSTRSLCFECGIITEVPAKTARIFGALPNVPLLTRARHATDATDSCSRVVDTELVSNGRAC